MEPTREEVEGDPQDLSATHHSRQAALKYNNASLTITHPCSRNAGRDLPWPCTKLTSSGNVYAPFRNTFNHWFLSQQIYTLFLFTFISIGFEPDIFR